MQVELLSARTVVFITAFPKGIGSAVSFWPNLRIDFAVGDNFSEPLSTTSTKFPAFFAGDFSASHFSAQSSRAEKWLAEKY
jgi:hypothetical protein